MKFGLFTSMGGQTFANVLDLWQQAERSGWDIACVTDHFMPNTPERSGAMLEGWTTLTALAALVPVGKPVKQLTRLKRRPVEEIAFRERFGGEAFAV